MLIVLLLAACSSVTPPPPPSAPPEAEVAAPGAEPAPPPAPAGKMSAEAYAACEARIGAVHTAEGAHPEARKELLDAALAAQAACRGAHNPDVDALDALVAKLQAEHDAGAW